MSSPKTRGARIRLVGAVLLAAGAAGAFGISPGTARAEGGGLIGVATAQTMRATYSVPDFLVVSNFLDVGAVAQSVVDSTGRATSFASLPYPGENAISAPGVIAAASGQPVIANYPFYVRAEYPTTPTAELKDPTGVYSLTAATDQGKASGNVDVAAPPGQDPASKLAGHTSAVTDADGKLTVTAESVVGPLSLSGGTLRIATVRSRSMTVYAPNDKEPQATAELTIEGVKVGETAVTIGPDGVKAAGQPVVPPAGSGTDPVSQALSQAGLSARVVSAAPVKGGAASDTLEIVSKHGPPGEGSPQGTFVLSFGGASTSITVGQGGDLVPEVPAAGEITGPDSGSAGTEPQPVDAAASGVADVPGSDSAVSGTSDFSAGAGLAGSGTGSAVPSLGSSSGDSASLPASVPEQAFAAPTGGAAPSLAVGVVPASARHSMRLLFAVVAAAGAVLLSTSTLWRTKGVHATWMHS